MDANGILNFDCAAFVQPKECARVDAGIPDLGEILVRSWKKLGRHTS